ncbi:MAG TPA: alkaline phosphatase family protein [Terriglobales bacterium]|nr:alkaline phosphatase family protein [Terriglobales bacterium]
MRTLVLLLATLATAHAASPKHIVVIALENHNYSSIIGNPNAPYINQLAREGALGKAFYATGHPSIDNYFRLTTGQSITFNDSYTGTVYADNLVRELGKVGKSWKNYAENLPYTGYLGGDAYPYVKHHNPFAYLSDVRGSSTQAARIVPFTRFSTDLSAGALPSFSYIQPNNHHNGHDCPTGYTTCTDTGKIVAMDNWLLSHVPGILNDPDFKQDGLLIIWFDESSTDNSHGGGRVAMIFAGPYAHSGVKSTAFYTHDSLLRTIGKALGIPVYPGNAKNVSTMWDMLTGCC